MDRLVIDLLVAGGGPIGLSTALYASRAGLSVTVVEPRASPIDKACGEGIMPGAVGGLRELGITLEGRAFRGIRYTDGRRSVTADFPNGPGLGVRRTTLHAALSEQVADRGITVLAASVERVETDGRSVTAAGVQARYLAAADGLHSPVRRMLGLDRRVTGTARYGLRRHFAISPWSDHVEVYWSPGKEAYVTPLGDHLVGVAVLTSERAPFDEQLQSFPSLLPRLPISASTAVRGAGPLRQASARRVDGRVLLVGDAAGYVDALTGEGIAVGLACARALVSCVAADRPGAYEREWLAASRRYRWLTSSLLWARNQPSLARAIVPAAERLPGVFRAAVGQLSR